jgi:hypothetical protein
MQSRLKKHDPNMPLAASNRLDELPNQRWDAPLRIRMTLSAATHQD